MLFTRALSPRARLSWEEAEDGSCYNTAHAQPPSLRIHVFECVRIAPVQGAGRSFSFYPTKRQTAEREDAILRGKPSRKDLIASTLEMSARARLSQEEDGGGWIML